MLLIYWKYEVNKLLQFRMITEIYICCNLWFSKFTPVEDEIYPHVKNPWSSLFDSILRAFKSVTVFPLDQESCFKVKIWIFLELLLVLWNRHFKYNGITLFWAYLICRTSLCVRIWRDVRYFASYRVLKALKNCRCGPISAWSSSSLIKSTLLLPNGYRPRPPKSMWGGNSESSTANIRAQQRPQAKPGRQQRPQAKPGRPSLTCNDWPPLRSRLLYLSRSNGNRQVWSGPQRIPAKRRGPSGPEHGCRTGSKPDQTGLRRLEGRVRANRNGRQNCTFVAVVEDSFEHLAKLTIPRILAFTFV